VTGGFVEGDHGGHIERSSEMSVTDLWHPRLGVDAGPENRRKTGGRL